MILTLNDITCGQAVTIIELKLEDAIVKRLYAMGVRPNKSIIIVRRGGVGGPLQCRRGTTDILIRVNIAQAILVDEMAFLMVDLYGNEYIMCTQLNNTGIANVRA